MTFDEFVTCLRDALTHLYDPDGLRYSPLTEILGLTPGVDVPMTLRQVLSEAVASLQPESDTPPGSSVWRAHDVLTYRYIHQLAQKDVARQMAVSVRHLRRMQTRALRTLATRLWTQCHLDQRVAGPEPEVADAKAIPSDVPTVDDELAWVRDLPAGQLSPLAPIVVEAVELARSLASQHGVSLHESLADELSFVDVHPTALREALLSLLGVAIRQSVGRGPTVAVRPSGQQVEIEILAEGTGKGKVMPQDHDASLSIAEKLALLCRGRLTVRVDQGRFLASLVLPATEWVPILVVDDNPDTLQLMERYVWGTRYQLITTRDPEEAPCLIEQNRVQAVVLDVMMPGTDGWRLLHQLRQRSATAEVPIIVCTVLAQEELALSLGANDFLRKPVSRSTFIAALDRQVSRQETGSRS